MPIGLLLWGNKSSKALLYVQPLLHLHAATNLILAHCDADPNPDPLRPQQLHGTVNRTHFDDITRLCKLGRLREAVLTLHNMDALGIPADHATYVSLLQGCVSTTALPEGKIIHAHFIQTGFNPNTFLQTKLLIVYAKCRILVDGRQVFDEMPERNVVSWTALIAAYSKNGYDKEALILLSQMRQMGIEMDEFTFASVLPSCANMGALEYGKEAHGAIIRSGFQCDAFIGSALLDLYFKCGSPQDACKVFDKMTEHDTVSSNAMLAGYTQNGLVREALKLFHEMPDRDTVSWNTMIAGCAQNGLVCEAAELFQQMPERSLVSWNTMISGYAQNGHVTEALKLFQEAPKQDTVSWNTMIAGYVQSGNFQDALNLFRRMQETTVQPSSVTFACILPACAGLAALGVGKEIHEIIIRGRFQNDIFVGNALMDMYAKCSSIEDALKVFDRLPQRNVVSWTSMVAGYAQDGHVDEALKFFQTMPERNVISWNAMVAGYAQTGYIDKALELFQKMPERDVVSWNAVIAGYFQHGYPYEALTLFNEMQVQGIKPSPVTMVIVLPICIYLLALEHGRQIHGYVIRCGFESDVGVGIGLVDLYAKCGIVGIAHSLFERMPKRNVVSWNAIISGYSQNGYPHEALALFNGMQVQGIKPNSVTVASVLPVCSDLLAVEQGKQIHGYAIRRGFEYDVVVGTGLVDMYAKCGNVNIAHKLFKRMPKKNVVSWNAMIAGYFQNGHPHEALAFFNEMQVQGIKGNLFTMVSILSACADSLTLEQGKQSHGYAIRSGFDSDVAVGTVLVDMYAKCGNVNIAHKLFERMPKRNAVSWNAIIAAYSQNGHPHEALAFFREMQVQGIKPDSITMITVLPVCADLLAVEQGKQFHGCVLRNGFESDVVVDTVLINMYAKCGHIDTAQRVFEKMSSRDVVAWNAMILGYGIHGHVEDALALFSRMQQMGTKPDHSTFIGVLTACSHAGLVEEGLQYFESMKSDYGLAPKLEHYSCLVDLLGRAGHLDEAYDIIKKMPLEPHAVVWGSLLGACRIHCNIELGEEAAKHLFELEPDNAGCYVLLSNIYAEAGRWEDVAKLRKIMKEREVKKQPGYSFIEVNRKVHTFLVGDRSHTQSEKIYTMLETMYRQMKEAGYVCQTNLVLQDVEEEVKENVLCSHSEKLAISFGIINTSPGTPIHIMKNLRVCSDCHNATKFISKIVRREIIVRDTNRFHHFKDGFCSCRDFW